MLCFVTDLRCEAEGRASTLTALTKASEAAGRKTRCNQLPPLSVGSKQGPIFKIGTSQTTQPGGLEREGEEV